MILIDLLMKLSSVELFGRPTEIGPLSRCAIVPAYASGVFSVHAQENIVRPHEGDQTQIHKGFPAMVRRAGGEPGAEHLHSFVRLWILESVKLAALEILLEESEGNQIQRLGLV
jgi:hypothetical protein